MTEAQASPVTTASGLIAGVKTAIYNCHTNIVRIAAGLPAIAESFIEDEVTVLNQALQLCQDFQTIGINIAPCPPHKASSDEEQLRYYWRQFADVIIEYLCQTQPAVRSLNRRWPSGYKLS